MPKTKKVQVKNNDYQYIEVLKRNRYKRHRYKRFFIEGVKSINLAIENNWEIDSFVYSGERPLSGWAKDVLRNSKADVHYELSANLMEELSDKEDSSELIAIGKIMDRKINDIKVKDDLLVVVFDRPSNPGNLGTIIRTCDAFGVDALIITGHSVDLYDPITIRSSIGAFFRLPVYRLESHKELDLLFAKLCRSNIDYRIVGTSIKGQYDIREMDYTKATILIVGNETYGMSNNYREMCDVIVKIPIYGAVSSLNVGCATSIFLYEVDSQRRRIRNT
mgnify:CR=1 FL=1